MVLLSLKSDSAQTAFTTKNYPAQNINRAEVKKAHSEWVGVFQHAA